MKVDYIDTSGNLVRCYKANPDVMIRTETDLTLLAGKYDPGTVAFTAGRLQEWQLAADGSWVPKVALDPETAAAQAAASAQRAATDARLAAEQATSAAANTAGLRGWSLTKEQDDTVSIDYTED